MITLLNLFSALVASASVWLLLHLLGYLLWKSTPEIYLKKLAEKKFAYNSLKPLPSTYAHPKIQRPKKWLYLRLKFLF